MNGISFVSIAKAVARLFLISYILSECKVDRTAVIQFRTDVYQNLPCSEDITGLSSILYLTRSERLVVGTNMS